MAKPYNDKKFQLGEPLATRLRAFCGASYNCPAIDVIREAVEEHLNRRLKEPEMLERYRKALEGLPIVPSPKQDGRPVSRPSESVLWLDDQASNTRHVC